MNESNNDSVKQEQEDTDVLLRDVHLFSGLSDDDLATIERHTTRKRYRKNTVIIERGDEAHTFYLVIEGRLKVFIAGEDGREIVLNDLGPGDYMGELALLGDTPRTASVVTQEDSEFLILTKQSFLKFVSDYPEITLTMMRDLAKRVADLADEVSSLALLDVYGRTVKLLNENAREEGDRLITDRFTHQEIANRVGSSREMVSKILKDLRVGGYISVEQKRFILNRELPARW